MIKIFSFLFLIILTNSCSSEIKRKDPPKDLIPKDSMVLILKDLTLIESHIKSKQPIVFYNGEAMKKSGIKVLENYNIDTLRFGNSFDYFGSYQNEIKSIYSAIIDSVNKEILLLKSK